MSQGRFRAGIRTAAQKDRLAMLKEQRELQESINKKSAGAQLGRLLGGGGFGLLAAIPALGLGPVGIALMAGLGSRLGSEVGELNAGRKGFEMEDLRMEGDYGYGATQHEQILGQMDAQVDDYDIKQWIQGGQDAFTAWSTAGLGKGLPGSAADKGPGSAMFSKYYKI